jgi:hypothetical protein
MVLGTVLGPLGSLIGSLMKYLIPYFLLYLFFLIYPQAAVSAVDVVIGGSSWYSLDLVVIPLPRLASIGA